MVSTRTDVENLLGKSEKEIKGFGAYKNENKTVSVWYSEGNCKTKQGLNWNIGKDVVTAISVRFENEVLLSSLKMEINKFSKRNHPNSDYSFFYTSPNENIIIQTFEEKVGKEEVWYIEFRPGKQYFHLLCEGLK